MPEITGDDGEIIGEVVDRYVNVSVSPFYWICMRCWRMVRPALDCEPAPVCPRCGSSVYVHVDVV